MKNRLQIAVVLMVAALNACDEADRVAVEGSGGANAPAGDAAAAAGGEAPGADAARPGAGGTGGAAESGGTSTGGGVAPGGAGGVGGEHVVPDTDATPGPDPKPDGGGPSGPDAGAGGAPAPGECEPDRHAWDVEMRGLVDTYCGQCHGETVAFGAPFTLNDYDALFVPFMGRRPVDMIAAALARGDMPPPRQPRPTDEEFSKLTAWSTCGEAPPRPMGPAGLIVSADPLPAPVAPPDLPYFDVKADEYALNEDAGNPYICFAVDAPPEAEGLIRRIEAVLDDQRVVHHLVLMHDRTGDVGGRNGYGCAGIFEEWIYAWGPGEGPLQFPAGGLRLSPGDRFIVQIHYNNGGQFPNVRDSSGVRVYYGPDEGPEYGLTALGPTIFELPAESRSQTTGFCTFPEAVDVLSSWPHMHELGSALESTIFRVDGTEEELISLRGWHFESQWIYATPTRMEVGDAVRTVCTFDNIKNRSIRFGPDTEDEMCFNFLYTTPPLDSRFCDGPAPPQAGGEVFIAGDCAPPGAVPGNLNWIEGGILQGAGGDPVGDGREPIGMWVLDSGELWIEDFNTPIGVIDAEASQYSARGYAVIVGDGNFYVDLQTQIHAVIVDGQTLDIPLDGSFSGPIHPGDAETPGSVDVECGQFGDTLNYAVEPFGQLVVSTRFRAGLNINIVARFNRR